MMRMGPVGASLVAFVGDARGGEEPDQRAGYEFEEEDAEGVDGPVQGQWG